jgi:alkylation response protein AidB-like acyl-CoA dehydrogenase
MQLDFTIEQQLLLDTFTRYFGEHSSIPRVRACESTGFDLQLWRGLADLGLFGMRMPGEEGMGLLDTALVMMAAGKRLAQGPLIEGVLAVRVLSQAIPGDPVVDDAKNGKTVIVFGPNAVGTRPILVPGGAVADGVILFMGDSLILWRPPALRDHLANHADQPLIRLDPESLGTAPGRLLAQGAAARTLYAASVEEWKLLTASMLVGLARHCIVLAADYAREREQFGRPVGSFQGISHPLAERLIDVEGAEMLLYSALSKIAARTDDAAAETSMAYWWAAKSSSDAVQRALHTFGGYGLTNEYDIQLYHRRAKGMSLVLGDPALELLRAGSRAWLGEGAVIPDAGNVNFDFSLGEEADRFAFETRQFFESNMTPEIREKSHFSFDGHNWDLNQALGKQRLLFPTWSVADGGRGADGYVAAAMLAVWDEFDVTTHAQSVSNMVGHVIARFGSEQLQRRYLPELAAGRIISSLGYTEPSSGSDVFAARTRAVRDGDSWLINGQKIFTSGANLASHVLLLTRTDPDAAKHRGITLFIVPLDAPGVEIQPIFTYQDERTNATFYSNVRVPDWARLGAVNGGAEVLSWALSLEQGGGGFCGPHQRVVKEALDWAKGTVRDGKCVLSDSRVLERISRAQVHARVSLLLFYRSLWLQHQGRGDRAAGPMSKLFSSEAFLRDATDLFDLTAPESLLRDKHGVGFIELSSRHATATTIYGGTSEVHRSQVAEKALGLPRSR